MALICVGNNKIVIDTVFIFFETDPADPGVWNNSIPWTIYSNNMARTIIYTKPTKTRETDELS